MKRKARRQRVDVDLQELDRIIDRAMQAPLSESDGRKLKTAVHAMAEKLVRQRSTEKTRSVLEGAPSPAAPQKPPVGSGKSSPAGHGRNGASAYRGARKVQVPHASLKAGAPCPDAQCGGKVYPQRDPGVLVRIKGQAPIAATVYELEKLR